MLCKDCHIAMCQNVWHNLNCTPLCPAAQCSMRFGQLAASKLTGAVAHLPGGGQRFHWHGQAVPSLQAVPSAHVCEHITHLFNALILPAYPWWQSRRMVCSLCNEQCFPLGHPKLMCSTVSRVMTRGLGCGCLSWLQSYDVSILEAEPTCCFSACNCSGMHLSGRMSEHCSVAHSPSPFCNWSEWTRAALAQQLAHAAAWLTA